MVDEGADTDYQGVTLLSRVRARADRLRALASAVRLLWLPRSRYKEVWNSLASTRSSAMISVLGNDEEPGFKASATKTRKTLLDSVGIEPSDVVLEIGCGVGRVGAVIAPLCARWIGADVSENMLRHARERLSGQGNVETVALSGYDLAPIASATIDVVYCTVVFMHLEEWDRYNYVREGWRVLKPGGRMLIDNFNLLSAEGWDFFEKQRSDYHPTQRPPHIARSSTPQEMQAYLERAGFENIHQRLQGQWVIAFGKKPANEQALGAAP